MRHFVLFAALGLLAARADIVTCHCDLSHPETLQSRECSLCREAEKQTGDAPIFFLKDINPTKPGRWLALPRAHARSIGELTAEQRSQLLRAAADKAKELFGEDWGIAYNAPEVQTQCHVHLHIGKWMPATEEPGFITVQRIEDVPVPKKGEGFWVHPVGGALHVHMGEPIAETVLLR